MTTFTEVRIPTGDGKTVKSYNVHKFSPLDGRKILAAYPLAILNAEHTYESNEAAMKKLMAYCSVGATEDEQIHLTDDALINEYVPDWWTLVQLEFECLKFNCSFLQGTTLLTVAKASMTDMLRGLVADHLKRIGK